MSIPKNLNADNIRSAAEAIDSGFEHQFGESTKYHAIIDGRTYSPKALIGVAAELTTGEPHGPYDFSSGESSGQAVGFLRAIGVEVVVKTRTWWVNQNQTYRAEFDGGYMWSPKRNSNGARNQFYENMKEVRPGDQVYSFRNAQIVAIGLVTSYCYDAPKPKEFGNNGEQWDDSGWRVNVEYKHLSVFIRPKDHIDEIRPTLPVKYSPLQQNGDGLQSVYLAEVNSRFASVIDGLLIAAGNNTTLLSNHDPHIQVDPISDYEDEIESQIQSATAIGPTQKSQLIQARRGQGKFRQNVRKFESACRISMVSDEQFLIASHIKPWRISNDSERLDGENGLLLAPNIDCLFDHGFISFADNGNLLVAGVCDRGCMTQLGIPVGNFNCGQFTEGQKKYLQHHRNEIWLGQ